MHQLTRARAPWRDRLKAYAYAHRVSCDPSDLDIILLPIAKLFVTTLVTAEFVVYVWVGIATIPGAQDLIKKVLYYLFEDVTRACRACSKARHMPTAAEASVPTDQPPPEPAPASASASASTKGAQGTEHAIVATGSVPAANKSTLQHAQTRAPAELL